ncbi:YbaB/EbfC family nucleoid-associated protein [Amycolatopsis sp. K13G38]|uniref:YbaB/EbfC family nucleoid-associated protein n=1 Tax=Amycolatopsis acididurans TaxID=2724524 RepID=A0ABX1IUW5_9PSEU|nr:YbaB/EbfC family nucleoid-associated protein [Amycolatopsis acididurans]
MRDPDQAAASVQAWADGLAEKAERYRAAQERTESIRLSSTNTDGSVRVTVRADGSVTDLALSGRARSMPLEELSAQILATMRRAQSGIADEVSDVMAEEIGDQDPETRSLMVDNLRSRFPALDEDDTETVDEEPPPAEDTRGADNRAEDSEDEDNNPW